MGDPHNNEKPASSITKTHNHHQPLYPSFSSDRRFPRRSSTDSLLKPALIISLLLSISLVIYSACYRSISFPSPPHWWPVSVSSSSSFSTTSPHSSVFSTCKAPSYSSPTNISHLLFNLAGSPSTWSERQHYSSLWYTPNTTTRTYIWLDTHPSTKNLTWPTTSPPFRVSSPIPPGFRASDRIARIIKESFDLVGPDDDVRWFVMGDDDTVFFPENLVTVLSKYDHRRMYYVGSSSESVEQVEMHSYRTAFGGGGFAMSYGLACHLSEVMDGCVVRYKRFYGSDEKVSACVGELGVPLTREAGFHQLDIRGDTYGLLSAHPISPLISLHHLDYVNPLFPNKTQLDSLTTLMHAYRTDPARIIQQTICYDRYREWSLSLSWGYTVQLYPLSLISSRELEIPLQTFTTWRSRSNGPFTFNTRPLSANPCEQPLVYFLDEVKELGKEGRTLTRYRRFDDVGKTTRCEQKAYNYAMGVETITVQSLKLDPEEWMTAPRRQCCEMKNGWMLKKNMQVKVRSCRPGETITA